MCAERCAPRLRALAAGALATLGVACQEEAVPEDVIRPVRTTVAQIHDAGRTRSFAGVAEAGQESGLSFKVAGTVERVETKVGDPVEQGQTLATLDASDYALREKEAEASLAQARAGARSAQSEYARVRSLYESQNASRSDLDRARGQAESTAAGERAGQQRLEQARQQVAYTRLAAPTAGVVSQVLLEAGENVSAGQRVVVLAAGERPEVRVAVPEVLIARIEVGAAVVVRLDAIPGSRFDARVTAVGVTASAGTTYPVEVTLDAAPSAIRPGMAASVEFTFDGDPADDTFVLPSVSVGEDRDGRFVYVVEPGDAGLGTVRRRSVEVGDLRADGLEILSGLEGGERVVTAGTRRVTDGLTVRLDPPQGSGP